jgi:hypothetical protein
MLHHIPPLFVLSTETTISTRKRTTTNRNKLNKWANYQQNYQTEIHDCEFGILKKKKNGADNIPQYIRRENLKRMPTQRPNPKGTFQNKLTSEDKTGSQKVCLFCVRLHDSLNGLIKTMEILGIKV